MSFRDASPVPCCRCGITFHALDRGRGWECLDRKACDERLRVSADAPKFDEVIGQTDSWTLLDALVHVAIWENDRAVKQALRGQRDLDAKREALGHVFPARVRRGDPSPREGNGSGRQDDGVRRLAREADTHLSSGGAPAVHEARRLLLRRWKADGLEGLVCRRERAHSGLLRRSRAYG